MPRPRPSSSARGYDKAHQKLRAQYQARMDRGEVLHCARCLRPIKPGQRWDLGHDDYDRSKYNGPEHAMTNDCPMGGNRATAGRPATNPTDTSRRW